MDFDPFVPSVHFELIPIKNLVSKENGSAANAGYAPYLDYRAATEEEQPVIRSFLEGQRWLTENVEDTATSYAISEIVPAHVSEVRQRTVKRVDKTVKAVKDRLDCRDPVLGFPGLRVENEGSRRKGQRQAEL